MLPFSEHVLSKIEVNLYLWAHLGTSVMKFSIQSVV